LRGGRLNPPPLKIKLIPFWFVLAGFQFLELLADQAFFNPKSKIQNGITDYYI
jgi:hypothetical protein